MSFSSLQQILTTELSKSHATHWTTFPCCNSSKTKGFLPRDWSCPLSCAMNVSFMQPFKNTCVCIIFKSKPFNKNSMIEFQIRMLSGKFKEMHIACFVDISKMTQWIGNSFNKPGWGKRGGTGALGRQQLWTNKVCKHERGKEVLSCNSH